MARVRVTVDLFRAQHEGSWSSRVAASRLNESGREWKVRCLASMGVADVDIVPGDGQPQASPHSGKLHQVIVEQ